MIVKCPECKREYNLELDDAVVELNFTCPNCGKEFKVRNVRSEDLRPIERPTVKDAGQANSAKVLRIATLIAFVLFIGSLIFWTGCHNQTKGKPLVADSVMVDTVNVTK